MSRFSSYASFFGPRYWPTWLMLGVARALSLLPYSAQLSLGRALGYSVGRFSAYRRHVVRTNLEICFPGLDDRRRMDLERAVFGSFGMGVFETFMAWWWPEHRLAGLARVEGVENLAAAQDRGTGVLLVSAHMTCLELCGRLLQQQVKTAFVYREQQDPLLETIWRRTRDRYSRGGATRHDLRTMIRILKRNEVLWFAPDQDYGAKHSTFVSFFGVPAATVTSVSRLAKISGALVVPFQTQRLPGAKGYLLRFEPALEEFPGGDRDADAQRINRIIERWIREDPEQYLWSHRRFKTRPPGQLKYYRPKRGRERRLPGEAEI